MFGFSVCPYVSWFPFTIYYVLRLLECSLSQESDKVVMVCLLSSL